MSALLVGVGLGGLRAHQDFTRGHKCIREDRAHVVRVQRARPTYRRSLLAGI